MAEHDGYLALSAKYLQEGDQLRKDGDYPQASEKFGGAVAELVKAIATLRGWRHSSHRDLRDAVNRLYQETRDEEIPTLFNDAEALHANFYENYLTPEIVALYHTHITQLVVKLRALAT